MAPVDTIQRVAPVALAILDDPHVTDHFRRAGKASRKGLRARRRPARRSPLQRLTEAITETLKAGEAARAAAERHERRQRRRRRAVVLAGLAGAAGAAAAVVQRSTDRTGGATS